MIANHENKYQTDLFFVRHPLPGFKLRTPTTIRKNYWRSRPLGYGLYPIQYFWFNINKANYRYIEMAWLLFQKSNLGTLVCVICLRPFWVILPPSLPFIKTNFHQFSLTPPLLLLVLFRMSLKEGTNSFVCLSTLFSKKKLSSPTTQIQFQVYGPFHKREELPWPDKKYNFAKKKCLFFGSISFMSGY